MGDLNTLVVARGRAHGLDAVGIADAAPFLRTRADLEARRAAGLNADMQFTYRDPERSTDPSRTLPGARSLVVGAVRYASTPAIDEHTVADEGTAIDEQSDEQAADVGARPTRPPTGRVARYAMGDHDGVLRGALAAIAEDLRHAGHRTVVLVDDNALVDRAAAHRAGIGWFGKSSNLLLPGSGSWFVLGSVLTDAPLTPASGPEPDGCGTCRRCVDGCPTGAIVADGVVDARRCLSWLLQSPGTFPHEYREALGDRIYGCDDCQEVCPPNRLADRRGDGGSSGSAGGTGRIDLLWMLQADDRALMAAAGRWYVPGRDPDHLRRNALLVLGNTAAPDDPGTVDALRRYLRHPDDHLASHAAWAAVRIGRAELLDESDVLDRSAVQSERPAGSALAPRSLGEQG